MPNAAMLMIVPLMIWSTRRLIDIQAWRSEISDRGDHGADERDEERRRDARADQARHRTEDAAARRSPTTQPLNAAVSIVPSMPMLTTPDRSQTTPHRAPKRDRRRGPAG